MNIVFMMMNTQDMKTDNIHAERERTSNWQSHSM